MAVYQAPDIKDRIAVGDDLYQIADSGGKKKLTPDPTEVTEAGTPINKALLQPLVDAVARIDTAAVPYVQYWWRRRPTASSWTETRQKSSSQGFSNKTATHTDSQDDTTYYHLAYALDRYPNGDEESSHTYATLTYASSISINQTNGAISLVNPTTYVCSESDHYYDSAFYQKFQGKYVKGFIYCTDGIFYIPPTMGMSHKGWSLTQEDATIYYDGYIFTADDKTQPMAINSVKNTTAGSWEPISSDADDTYPKSGTSGGYDWKYLGKISEAVTAPTESAFDGVTTIQITSASWSSSGSTYNLNVTIPCKRYCLWISISKQYHASGVVDNGLFSGTYRATSSSGSSNSDEVVVGVSGIYLILDMDVTATGLSFSTTYAQSFTIGYMSLDK